MKTVAILLIPISTAVILFFAYRIFAANQTSVAALQVTATPQAEVFLDNVSLGKTPLSNDKLKTGDHTLKLVPVGGNGLFNFEEKLTLREGILTVVDRIFKPTDAESETSILSLEHISIKNATEVTIVSSPEGAEVKLDDQPQGITPLLIKDITPSDHQVTISKKGYNSKTLRIHPTEGYRLTTSIKLSILTAGEDTQSQSQPAVEATQSAQPKKEETKIVIKDTPTGFLRVRETPSVASKELAKVKPGESYTLLDEQDDWYKIAVSDEVQGWISTQYADKQ